ncbi:N-acetylmuramoyl-L-alanine amidase [Nocardioides sp.]|uniref:N-acetylmuramoyl-L-alanine amidase family protein n=1 Tax=Nocardioides sp. TaxID=35761 RepID=UPI003518627F
MRLRLLVCAAALLAAASASVPTGGAAPVREGAGRATPVVERAGAPTPVVEAAGHGRADTSVRGAVPTVVLDPGHQLGNRRHGAQIRRPVDAGGFTKPCNTTGTATNAGVPESTIVWGITQRVARVLRARGVRVVLTRSADSDRLWGPCVDVRGRLANPGTSASPADLRVSIHADGSLRRGARGFHVIAPSTGAGRGVVPVQGSVRLARSLRDALVQRGLVTSTYTGRAGLVQRSDIATLNLSAVPAAMIETGNLRDPSDARRLTSASGQQRVADAVARGILAVLADRSRP